ncbi:enhancer of rudimentary homolog [Mucor ambiguus]|uniref:Enhancer of rudimentary homolog n=1 Tax=Mucor ambiguus TaxID=91626 RepID=A0A0C9MCD5_9FUNG|nr:enhancer of rudimentary homolog [Mucor ambiguus]
MRTNDKHITTVPELTCEYDFPTESEAMDHIAGLYEVRLAKENPNAGQVQYRAEDLFRFIDTYKEFVALVFDPSTLTYQPRDKDWIKDRLIVHFSGQQAEELPQVNQQPRYNNNHNQRRRRH